MTTKFKLLNYLFIFIGLIDVVIFAKIFPTIYVELILLILFILGIIMNVMLNNKNKPETPKKDGSNLKNSNVQKNIYGFMFSFIFLFLLFSTSSYTLKMSRIFRQGFDILIALIFFSLIFFVYKFCDSLFDDGNKLLKTRVGGVYINPKHPIGKIFFLLICLIPIYIILSAIFNGPISINT